MLAPRGRLALLVVCSASIAAEQAAAEADFAVLLAAAGLLTGPLAIEGGQLVTSAAVRVGTVLLEVPREFALSKDSAQETSLLQYLDPEDGVLPRGMPHWAALPDEFVLALQLLLLWPVDPTSQPMASPGHSSAQIQPDGRVLTRHGASHEATASDGLWRAWLRLAAAQLGGTAHWEADELQRLDGSHALKLRETRANELERHVQTLLEPLRRHAPHFFGASAFDASALRTAFGVIEAHAIVPSESGAALLLPLPPLPLAHDGLTRFRALPSARGTVQLVALKVRRRGTIVAPSWHHRARVARGCVASVSHRRAHTPRPRHRRCQRASH